MSIKELIAALQKIDQAHTEPESVVHLNCPVANTRCWLHEEDIKVSFADGTMIVTLQGGTGA